MKHFIILFIVMKGFHLFAQADKPWKRADAFLQTQHYSVKTTKDLKRLGNAIEANFPDTLERLRAVYLWVTQHIKYDCDGLRSKNSRWALDSVLLSGKAVCAGFVNVFRNLCHAAGIACVDVNGFGRSGFEDLVLHIDSFRTNHTWNAVRINGNWKLTDVTWGAGYTDEDCSKFTPWRNDWYFCQEPSKFIWDHYPQDSSWQLLSVPVSWQEFYRYPLLYQGVHENLLEDFYPGNVFIDRPPGDTIRFVFRSKRYFNRIIVRSRSQKHLYRMDIPERNGEFYTYVYRVNQAGNYDLELDLLYVDDMTQRGGQTVMSYTDIIYWIRSAPTR